MGRDFKPDREAVLRVKRECDRLREETYQAPTAFVTQTTLKKLLAKKQP